MDVTCKYFYITSMFQIVYMSDKNIQVLADLLAKAVGIKPKDHADDTIEAAIDKLEKSKDTKVLGQSVENSLPIEKKQMEDLEKQPNQTSESETKVEEQIADLYTATINNPTWDILTKKYMGVPDLKSWADIQLNRDSLCGDVDEEVEWADNELDDTDFDRENGITYNDIDQFLSTMPVDDFAAYYDDGEIEVTCGDQDCFLNNSDYCDCAKYDDNQLQYAYSLVNQRILDCTDPHQLRESLTLQQRLMRAIKLRAKAAQIAMKRKIAMRRPASPEKIQLRARRLAIRMLKSKFAGNRPYNELNYADRERVEKIISTKQSLVDALQRKMVPIVRKIEQERFAHQTAN